MAATTRSEPTADYVYTQMGIRTLRPERQALEEQWASNWAYYHGHPYMVRDGGTIRQPNNLRKHRGVYNANMILPKVQRSVARLIGLSARFMPLPNSSHRNDLHAAKIAEHAFRWVQQITDFQAKLRRNLQWAAICGSGIYRVSWDPNGPIRSRVYLRADSDDVDIEALLEPTGELRRQREKAGRFVDRMRGEVAIDIVEPWYFRHDESARGGGLRDCQWAGTETARPLNYFREQYGIEAAADADLDGTERFRDALAYMAGADSRQLRVAETQPMARELEYFERPTKRHPGGRHVIVAAGRVVLDDVNIYGCLPYAKCDWFHSDVRFWGVSLVELLRAPQRARNDSREAQMRCQKTAGFAPLLMPRGSGVTPVNNPAIPGVVLEYDATSAGPPVFGQPPQLPPYVFQNSAEAEQEMDKIAAQADPTNSRLPGQLRSGSGVQSMIAENNLILTPTSEELLETIAEIGTQALAIIERHYDEPRITAVIGPNGDLDTRRFSGSDLRGHYRMRVHAQPGFMDSAETRQAKVLDAASIGVLNPQNPDDRLLLMRAMNFNTADDWMAAALQQETDEWRQIDRIVENDQYRPQPQPWNNAEVRAKVLERYLNSPEFEQIGDPAKQALVERWGLFKQEIARQMEAQMQMLQMQKGAPGQTGQASQPNRSNNS